MLEHSHWAQKSLAKYQLPIHHYLKVSTSLVDSIKLLTFTIYLIIILIESSSPDQKATVSSVALDCYFIEKHVQTELEKFVSKKTEQFYIAEHEARVKKRKLDIEK